MKTMRLLPYLTLLSSLCMLGVSQAYENEPGMLEVSNTQASNQRIIYAGENKTSRVSLALDIESNDNGKWVSLLKEEQATQAFKVGMEARLCINASQDGWVNIWNRYSDEKLPTLIFPTVTMGEASKVKWQDFLSSNGIGFKVDENERVCIDKFVLPEFKSGISHIWIEFSESPDLLSSQEDYEDFGMRASSAGKFMYGGESAVEASESPLSSLAEWQYRVLEEN